MHCTPSSLFKSVNYAEYTLKQQAIDALHSLPASSNAQLFAKDKGDADNPGSQVFVISTPKQVYQRSVSSLINGTPANFYEWMGPFQKANGDDSVKLALDLDMEGVDPSRAFNDDIVWTVDHVAHAIQNAFHTDVPRPLWIVLKTDYDPIKRKHSAHLVLDGFKFANTDARKTFLGNLDLVTEFSKRCPEAASPLKVVDSSVFGKKMFRLFKSSKAHKNLPFWAANIEGFMPPEDNLEFFLKTMATYTQDCQLLVGESINPAPALSTASSSSRRVSFTATADTGDSAVSHSFERFVPPWHVITAVLGGLDPIKRCATHTYDNWTEVGWCFSDLARRSEKFEEGREVWLDFCRRDLAAFDQNRAIQIFDAAHSDGRTLGWSSMMRWLAEDNPTLYETIKTQLQEIRRREASARPGDVEHVISRGGSDTSFARLLVARSRGVYAASNSKGAPNILKFDGFWRREAEKIIVNDLLKLVPEFDGKLAEAHTEILEVSGEEDDSSLKEKKRSLVARRKAIQYCISRLESNGHKNSIIREFAALVYKDGFESALDGISSAHLLCFEDGVYDLNLCVWRDATPEDMISVSTRYSLRNTPVDMEIRNSIKAVLFAPFSSEEVALSRMIMNAAALNGAINFKKVLIDTGSKNNGKSSQNEFFADTLGDYALTLPNSVLTTRIDAGKPFPELDRAKRARCVLVKDFESGHKILPGNFKALSGGDKQATRGLWANIEEWRPRFQLRIACNNDLPEFQNNGGGDEGILTRLLMYHFAKRFSENPRGQNELPLDRSLPAKLASLEWKQQYMLWLLDMYKENHLADGFLPAFPHEVVETTDNYKKDVDSLRAFIDERLRIDRDKSDSRYIVKKKQLYRHYTQTRREGTILLQPLDFSKQMMSMLDDNYRNGRSDRDKYYIGLELIYPEPEMPEADANAPFID